MVNLTTRTIIHDEHTQNTIIIKNATLCVNKGDLINITNNDKEQIKGTVIKIHNDITVYDDDIKYYCVHVHVY